MVQLKEISDFISRFKNQDNTHMVKIFDSSGTVILNPNNPDLVMQRFNEKSQKVFTNSQYFIQILLTKNNTEHILLLKKQVGKLL